MGQLQIQTHDHEEMADIITTIRKLIRENGWTDGALLLHCPHTTGAVTINEGADPDVVRDILVNIRKLVPHRDTTTRPKELRPTSNRTYSTVTRYSSLGRTPTRDIAKGHLLKNVL